MNYTYQELTKVTREFRDLSTDLLNSTTNTLNTSLNFFKAFCEDESIITEILQPIKENNFDSENWYQNALQQRSSMAGSGDGTLPTKKIDALKVIYDILWSENANRKIIDLIFNTMFTKKYDEMINRFNNNFTRLLVRHILRRLEDETEMVKPQPSVPGNTFNTFNGPTNYATNSNSVNQNIQINNPDLIEVINLMREAIDNSTLELSEKQDALETIEMIENEVLKDKPSKSKVQKLLAFLPTVESLVSLGDTLITNLPI